MNIKKSGYQKKKWQQLEKRVADLERQVQGQQIMIEILIEFARSVTHTEKKSLISYQQLHSPSADSCKYVRMLLDKGRKFLPEDSNGKHTVKTPGMTLSDFNQKYFPG